MLKSSIPANDPVLKFEHNELYLKDRDSRKKLINELKLCQTYVKRKKRFCIQPNALKELKRNFMRRKEVVPFTLYHFKKYHKKTLVFDCDNTLVKSSYK